MFINMKTLFETKSGGKESSYQKKKKSVFQSPRLHSTVYTKYSDKLVWVNSIDPD